MLSELMQDIGGRHNTSGPKQLQKHVHIFVAVRQFAVSLSLQAGTPSVLHSTICCTLA